MKTKKIKPTKIYQSLLLLAWCLVVYAIFFAIWTVFNTETGNGDNVEHIHSTWLVSQGKIPYKDFFQHHNPLMWYIFAPLIRQTTNLLIILDMAHAIGIIAGIATFFTVYKIARNFFAASSLPILLALLILCPPYYYIYCFNYNPDTFMALFYAIGLYFLFDYWQKRWLFTLVLSFVAFFLSFMFTQKILMVFFVLGIISLIVFYHKKTPFVDILYALALPITSLLLFIALLYSNDALDLYWKSNYLFNVVMQDYYGFEKIDVVDYQALILSVGLTIISLLCCIKGSNLYFKVFGVLFVIELILRCFYFSIAPYYLLPLMIYSCCLNSVIIEKILEKKSYICYLFICIGFYYAGISKERYTVFRPTDRSFARYLMHHITPCDYVLSSYFGNQSIINKDPHYYWSMLGHIDIAAEKMGLYPKPNVDELVLKYKPKFVFGGIYWNSYYLHRGKDVFVQQLSPQILSDYYLPTQFPEFYILKYEYQHKQCTYNKQTKEWEYAD